MYIALVMIESEFFREFIYVIASILNAFIIASFNIIRNWIMKLFKA
jgi:hypothetical protein